MGKGSLKRSKTNIILVSLLFFFFLFAFAQQIAAKPMQKEGHIVLLAVAENGQESKGSIADLSLEIRDGSGKVYLDTFPLSKIDTQLSTRFARDYACNYLEIDCMKLDFFYTIRSDSLIIGGPSAGAAATVLSIAVLDNRKIDSSIAMTGTINSGGFIGAVGGLKAKITTSAENGLKKVLIPKGSRYYVERDRLLISEDSLPITTPPATDQNKDQNNSNQNNQNNQNNTNQNNIPETNTENNSRQNPLNLTTDLYEFGKEKGIAVQEVLTVEEALLVFTGHDYRKEIKEITLDPFYILTMKNIATDLCGRTEQLQQQLKDALATEKANQDDPAQDAIASSKIDLVKIKKIEEIKKKNTAINATIEETNQLINKSKKALDVGQFYAASSYCYGANVNINTLLFQREYLTKEQELTKLDELLNATLKAKVTLQENQLKTITDLQAYIIVKDRLVEAEELISKTTEAIKITNATFSNVTLDASYQIAFATERVYSAYLWSSFFTHHGKEFNLNNDVLRAACVKKFSEVEELLQYLQLSSPFEITDITQGMKKTNTYLQNGQFKECLAEAAKTKADIDVILTTNGVNAAQLKDLLDEKIKVIKQSIGKQQDKEIFPIVGYSYYEYSQSLAETDIISALIYAEYAIEFSNIDVYLEDGQLGGKQFSRLEQFKDYFNIDIDMILIFAVGIFVGIVLSARNTEIM